MVNVNTQETGFRTLSRLVACYVAAVAATLVVLVLLTIVESAQATTEAWVHAVIVAVFAALLPLRLRSARRGKRSGLRAVGLIAGALVLVNVVEALLPHLFPTWMRVDMIGIAVLMAFVVLAVVRIARRG